MEYALNKCGQPVRDEHGRPVARDGYPTAGLATVKEVAAVAARSVVTIRRMIYRGELKATSGHKAVRVPWQEVRRAFIDIAVSERGGRS